jgi:hypothetical protein
MLVQNSEKGLEKGLVQRLGFVSVTLSVTVLVQESDVWWVQMMVLVLVKVMEWVLGQQKEIWLVCL